MTYKVDNETRFAGEGSVLKLSSHFFRDKFLRASVEAKSGFRIFVVEVHSSVVLLHAGARAAPVQMQVNHYSSVRTNNRGVLTDKFLVLRAGQVNELIQ